MPKRSDFLRYRAGDCLEVVLDISDAPGARFESATFHRGGVEMTWPLLENAKIGRAEFRSLPDHLILFLVPPKEMNDDPSLPLDQIQGTLEISLTYDDPKLGTTRVSVPQFLVVPASGTSYCAACESQENAIGHTHTIIHHNKS
jgi:hypothetical protein